MNTRSTMKPITATATALRIAPGTSWNSPTFTPVPSLPPRWNTSPGPVPSGAASATSM
ncbi:hypothetical protein D3C86_1041870 [compost metagenome]